MKPIQRVRGFYDLLPETLEKRQKILSQAFEVAKRFCCSPVETPIVEQAEIFKRTLGKSSSAVNKEMYTFQKGDDELALRPEGTAAIARMFITEKLQAPARFVYQGPMFRHERPQKGRLRQFTTVAVEILGESEETADVEACAMAWIFLKELEIENKVNLEINTIGSSEERKLYIQKLVSYLKPLTNKLSSESQLRLEKNPLRILDSKQEEDQDIIKKAPSLLESLSKENLSSYDIIKEKLKQLNIPFKENPHLVRGLDYYNNLVFEFKSSFLGAQSTLLAGGRYDSLIPLLGGPSVPAVGWGAGVERIALLYEKQAETPCPQIGLIAVGEEAQNQAFQTSHFLREKGYSVFYRFTGNFSKQMTRITKHNCSIALFYGDKEIENKSITFKNLKTKQQHNITHSQLETELKKLL